ncbi:MAG: hypothetical protein WCG80_08935 [Spirochaetales bacterium]
MQVHDLLPFWPDKNTYFVPWVKFKVEDGSKADGPMLRKASVGQELLAWTTHAAAETAALELVAQTGGSFVIKTMDRKDLWAQCKQFASWGTRVVAVVLK